jgi:hypothetical protein
VSTPNKIEGEFSSRTIDLRGTAAATAVVIGTVAAAALAYRLIDVLLLLFIGIAVAAALQPSHEKLCRWGVPKGLAVLPDLTLVLDWAHFDRAPRRAGIDRADPHLRGRIA